MGIIIQMFWNEHNPPHFHARYGRFEASFDIKTLGMMDGNLPPRIRGYIVRWAAFHQDALLENWNRCRNGQDPKKLPPI